MRVQVRYPTTESGYAEQTFYVPGFYAQFPVLIDKLIEKDGVYQAEVCIKVEAIYIDKEGNIRLSPSTSFIKKVSIPEEKVSLLRETPWYDTSLHQFIIEKKEGENTTIQYKYEIEPFKAEIKSVEKYDTSDPENWLLKEANYLTKLAQYKGTASLREIINQFHLSSKPEKKLLEIYPENISLNIYQIQQRSEISYCFYLEGYTRYPALVVGDRIITIFDKENKTAYSYYPETGDLVYKDKFLKSFTSNVSSQIKGFMNDTAKVEFEGREDEFNAYFNNFVKNIKEAEIWVREAYGKDIYMIYDSEHRYPVITIDEVKVHFGEKIDSGIWRQRSFEKVPIRLPVTTPPIVLIRERTGKVIEKDQLIKEFPFLNLTQRDLPQAVEEYIAYDSKGQVWYTYYQEPRDVFGRVILRVSSIKDVGRYVYYVKEYDKTNIYQPKLAYLYFNPENETGGGGYSDNWYKCFTYKTEEILTLKNIFAELNLSFGDRESLKKDIGGVLSFITQEPQDKIENISFAKTKVIDAENQSYYIYVVKGDSEGRVIFKHKKDALNNFLIVNTQFFGYTTTASSGYFKDLKTGAVWKFENKDMQNATVNLTKDEGKSLVIGGEKTYLLPEDSYPYHRILFYNPETGEYLLRWYPSFDPIGGRYGFEEKGYFRIIKEPADGKLGEVEWVPIAKTEIGNWSSIAEVPLNWSYYEYNPKTEKIEEKYNASTQPGKLINTKGLINEGYISNLKRSFISLK